jgi:hypothetical protein
MELTKTYCPANSTTKIVAFFVLSVAIFITLYVYWPGLNGTFILDDISNLSPLNAEGGVTDFSTLQSFVFGNNSGLYGRPVSMLSFLIDDQYYPGDVAKYRYTNLMIHLLCGLLIFILLMKILENTNLNYQKQLAIAALTSTIWLFHPLNASTTLYVIQRIAQVMTLFTLIGLIFYVIGRKTLNTNVNKGILYMTLGMVPFGLLAVLSKENGVLIAVYITILECTVFRSATRIKLHKIWLAIFILAPLILLALYFTYNFSVYINGYTLREFNMLERLLTESRVLITYLYHIIVPQSGNTGLYQDDFLISKSLLSPPSTLFSILAILSLLVLAIRYRKKYPIFSFSVFWFFGGHILESTFISLEIYFEHRNYLPMVGPLFGLIYTIVNQTNRIKTPTFTYLTKGIIVIPLVAAPILTFQSANLWGNPHALYKVWHYEHPNSLRAATIYALSLANYKLQPTSALDVLSKTFEKHPDAIALPILSLYVSCKFNIDPIFSASDISSIADIAKYKGILPTATMNLLDAFYANKCKNIDIDDMHKILYAAEKTQNLNDTVKARILAMHSDLYVKQQQLSPSIELLDEAFKHDKNATIPIRQAILLSSAGLYKDALLYLEKAETADKQRKKFVPSKLPVINKLKETIFYAIKNT